MTGNNIHLVVLGFLIISFSGLIFFSTSSSGLSINYEFKDSIEITTINNPYDSKSNLYELGKITVSNEGMLPKKVYLDSYVLCFLSESGMDKTYNINYRGKTKSDSADIFNYNYLTYVELSSGQTQEITIEPQYYYDLRHDVVNYNLNGQEIPFYLFKVDSKDRYYYDFCSSAKKEDANKIIMVKFNINESELKEVEDKAIPTYKY